MAHEMPAVRTPGRIRIGKITIVAVIASAIVLFFLLDVGRVLSLDSLKANRDHVLAFTEANYTTSVVLFIALYVAVAGLSLPGATILTLAGGFVFGPVAAALYVNIGATTGATLAFLAARYVLRDWVEQKFGNWLEPLQQGFARNAFSYLLTLRLIPLFPFFVVNLVSGLTRVSVGTYVAATALGIIPGSLVYAYAGRQLGSIDSLKEIASPQVIAAFVLLGAFALAPVFYKKLSEKSA
jgi:uncharacterized membrane protein YdjX (TVP38/TMEM64 family)